MSPIPPLFKSRASRTAFWACSTDVGARFKEIRCALSAQFTRSRISHSCTSESPSGLGFAGTALNGASNAYHIPLRAPNYNSNTLQTNILIFSSFSSPRKAPSPGVPRRLNNVASAVYHPAGIKAARASRSPYPSSLRLNSQTRPGALSSFLVVVHTQLTVLIALGHEIVARRVGSRARDSERAPAFLLFPRTLACYFFDSAFKLSRAHISSPR
uniref:Uncharacterized protein n=1 Tax=Mycena chlorophos TaxID=658473 RepID=A0ABQ0L3D5_MYCCL|nr:predicted protein [Mycena chlorophos]